MICGLADAHRCSLLAPEQLWTLLHLERTKTAGSHNIKKGKATCWLCNISVNMGPLEQLAYE